MTVKDDLHHLVDQLDEAAADELLEYARWLIAEEDEPLSDEERARVEAGEGEIRRGDHVRLEYAPEVDVAYLRLRSATVASTDEIAPGVLMDVGTDRQPVGFELLDASEVLGGAPQGVTFELVRGCPSARAAPAVLLEAKVLLGRVLVDALDQTPVRPFAAFWVWNADAGQWDLLIGTEMVEREGPIAAHREIQRLVLAEERLGGTLALRDILVLGRHDGRLDLVHRIPPTRVYRRSARQQ